MPDAARPPEGVNSLPPRLAEPELLRRARRTLGDEAATLAPRAALAELSELESALIIELARRGLASLRAFEAHTLPDPHTLTGPPRED